MAKVSVLDRIRELDNERAKLLDDAKTAALANAEAAIAELNELGFTYRLTQDGKAPRVAKVTGGTRRTGIREEVLAHISANADGITSTDLLAKMDANDKAAKQAVANALSALKKDGKISGERGHYRAA
jgi:hypothetical protein